jgi:hypothetical protein
MTSSLEISFTLPNLGTLIYYVVFVLAIPAFLLQIGALDVFKYYFPAIVMFASVLTKSGEPRYFQSLYPQTVETTSAFFSKNIMNLLAIIGILTNCLVVGMATGNLVLGLVTGVLAFTFTFPVANQLLPFIIEQVDNLLKDITVVGTRFPGNWHKYFTGIVFIIFFMALQMVVLRLVKNTNLVATLSGNNNTTSNGNNVATAVNNMRNAGNTKPTHAQ